MPETDIHDVADGIACFDESGSNPGLRSTEDDYSLCGVFVSTSEVPRILELDEGLQAICGRKDYKGANVSKCVDARKLMERIRSIESLRIVSIGSTMSGIAQEPARVAEVTLLADLEPARDTSLRWLVEAAASISLYVAYESKTSYRIYWDRRSDLQRLGKVFMDTIEMRRSIASFEPSIPVLELLRDSAQSPYTAGFFGEHPPDLRGVTRVAGVIAYDIVAVCRRFASAIFGRALRPGRARSLQEFGQFCNVAAINVGKIAEPLGKFSYLDCELPMFRVYAPKLASGQFTVCSPHGQFFHVARTSGKWSINQVPD